MEDDRICAAAVLALFMLRIVVKLVGPTFMEQLPCYIPAELSQSILPILNGEAGHYFTPTWGN